MTNKEAQNEIVRNKGVFKYDPTMTEALDLAIQALEEKDLREKMKKLYYQELRKEVEND